MLFDLFSEFQAAFLKLDANSDNSVSMGELQTILTGVTADTTELQLSFMMNNFYPDGAYRLLLAHLSL